MKRLAVLVAALGLVPLLALLGIVAAFGATQPGSSDPTGCAPGGPVAGTGAALAASAARAAGFTGNDLIVAVAVAGAESSYNPLVRNSIGASGLWQILESAHPDLFARYDWRNPAQNGVMAYSVWKVASGSWTPWTTWTSGAYVSHLGEARTAVAALGAGTQAPDPCGGTPGGAAPFPGGASGCVVPDPSGTGGCVTPALAWLMSQVHARFGHLPVSCWSARGGDPYSDHPKGRACDYTMGKIGTYPGPVDVAHGWALAIWLRANAVPLHVDYVIWQGRIWSRAHDTEGWRTYTGGGVYSTTGPTNSHADHVHVSTID